MKLKITFPCESQYSDAFKRQVVGEYEHGGVTKDDLMRKYQIRGHSTVLLWCRKYGKLPYQATGSQGRPMKDPQKKKIKELEHELKKAKEQLMVYEKLIEITNRELDVDIQKKIATKLSKNWHPKVG
jgi:transposase